MTTLNYQELVRMAKWNPIRSLFTRRISQDWSHWIASQGSLTSMLNSFSGNKMHVNIVNESWGKPTVYEANKLGICTSNWAYIREVELYCDDQAMVFARSIIPRHVYNSNKATLGHLGTQPLGHLLFRHARQRNRLRDVCVSQFNHPHSNDSASNIYGRATPYAYNGGEILVQEFFINPALIKTK